MNELDLVLRYAPVLLFSKDDKDREEDFFPVSTAHYVAESSLHKKGEGVLKARTALSLDDLAAMTPSQSSHYYLTFAADEILEHDPSLRNRLAHGGLAMFSIEGDMTPGVVIEDEEGVAAAEEDPALKRSPDSADLDAGFAFSSPGEETPPADVSFVLTDAMQLPDEVHKTALERYEPYRDFSRYPPVFYYSTLNSRGYLVLQYWFFYAYNDWGTGHGGVNDHEGDWEMIALFLRDNKPRYIAYSAHTGAPEHHRWEASEVHKVDGTHPVIYVGCGSHANYFHSTTHDMFGYTDYAFGNSAVSIGPGTDVPWAKPINLGAQSWALNYAGGWGAMVKRFGSASLAPGAQSPVGPPWQFKRWESPVGWAKVPLP
ncbi:MAG TPA: hypothetical protein VLE70_11295 [Anaerolineae bacterium]|jgi:hypothetical protein|nr:hypothetical protein [Anaerolineae bacterium]